jgi:uncharacterized DUF497 family protein
MAAEIRFEWDMKKSETNRRKHGIDFDEARAAFFDPLKYVDIEGHEHGEIRWRTIGEIGRAIYVVSHTLEEEGGTEIVRIITARKATRRERRAYEREA